MRSNASLSSTNLLYLSAKLLYSLTISSSFLFSYSEEFEYINPVSALYPNVELIEEGKLNYITTLLVVAAELTGKAETPAKEDKAPLTAKEHSLQNKVDMLYRQNDLLMNELDKQCGYGMATTLF